MAAFAPCTPLSVKSVDDRSSSTCATPRMSLKLSRRAALAAGLALAAGVIAPTPSEAKGGDAPKISIFGVGGASSPFTAGVQTGGQSMYERFNEEELSSYKKNVDASKERLVTSVDAIKGKSWDDVRSMVRLEMGILRNTFINVNKSITDKKAAKDAEKAYRQFKTDIENLDYAAITKNQDKAYKSYNSALKSLDSWSSITGI